MGAKGTEGGGRPPRALAGGDVKVWFAYPTHSGPVGRGAAREIWFRPSGPHPRRCLMNSFPDTEGTVFWGWALTPSRAPLPQRALLRNLPGRVEEAARARNGGLGGDSSRATQ